MYTSQLKAYVIHISDKTVIHCITIQQPISTTNSKIVHFIQQIHFEANPTLRDHSFPVSMSIFIKIVSHYHINLYLHHDLFAMEQL